MAGLDSARLRNLADELDAEEAEAKRDLEQAETKEERDEIKATLEELKVKNAELEQRLAAADHPPGGGPAPRSDEQPEAEETTERPKMRRGRKHGQVYQERPGEAGYVYQGEDEPDLVPVEDDADAA